MDSKRANRASAWTVRAEESAVDELAFEGGEEARARVVVVAVSNRAGGGPHLLVTSPGDDARVLAVLVGVVDDAPEGTPQKARFQHLRHQLGTQMARHRSAHHTPAEGVDHHREAQESRPSGHVGEIGHPQPLGAGAVKSRLTKSRMRRAFSPRCVVSVPLRRLAPSSRPLALAELPACGSPGVIGGALRERRFRNQVAEMYACLAMLNNIWAPWVCPRTCEPPPHSSAAAFAPITRLNPA